MTLSRSQVKKAGSTIRRFTRGVSVDTEDYFRAVEVMDEWRRSHQQALVSANMGLRSRITTLGIAGKVSQRLKRSQTILDKLQREPSLDLSRMQDIGGCRAVVPDLTSLQLLQSRLVNGRVPILRVADYVTAPRISGYRAVHVVVEYRERAIEVQLRTPQMHAWAQEMERISGQRGENLKQDGTHPIQLYMAAVSRALDAQERGELITRGLLDELEERRLAAFPEPRGDDS